MDPATQTQWTTHRRGLRAISALAIAAGVMTTPLAVAGPASAITSHARKSVVISTFKSKKLGTLLESGTTVYSLKPTKVACTATCLQIWPAVLLPKGVTKATAGSGVNAAKLGTIKRPDGELQVTYGGKALYRFFKDKSAGQVNGNVKDKWGAWSDVVTVHPAGTVTGTSSGNTGTGGVAF